MNTITPKFISIVDDAYTIDSASSITISNTSIVSILITNSSGSYILPAGNSLNLNTNMNGFNPITINASGASASICFF